MVWEFINLFCIERNDGSRVLSKLISELWNLSIKLGSFPDCCKIAKLKTLFKKGSKANHLNYRPVVTTFNFQNHQKNYP